ncbi:methylmalonyl Co-A mutase-associated GTPase MeaB [Neobacillus notoginsengisoli]|uniref:Methylmalonyl Co-A mutase-associated GTPase MeaB n=1 Tax=Neobacillus notoginsengisoli TaxID=1578198 RepID=A0A417YV42_9BACI|nr:methylmalonyl Co-A mutase-associated GTPase MeaB [Neobacillus notoginsengisoli]RHW41139.1 methylmalonyl Co-A mutase-associated GTPase MeaB [Neobacillus notoginsengisoli]
MEFDGSMEKKKRFKKKPGSVLQVDALTDEILQGNRSALAKGITLVESNAAHHFREAQSLLQKLLPSSGKSIRIGITGVPGAGKSTFIEAFGVFLCGLGHKVAVLAIDPSSTVSGGSILGDKTRMERLSRQPNAFIRPSPSGGKLGGVHRKTRESMLLCEAAGFDVILIETVGVGQSEVAVREMVDFFMLLVLTGAGDELQGMKKGIMELADAIVVNKADGANEPVAEKTRLEYKRIIHFLQRSTPGWDTKALSCSALTGKGIPEIWTVVRNFRDAVEESGVFGERRKEQIRDWLHTVISDHLHFSFYQNVGVKSLLPKLEKDVLNGEKTAAGAADELFEVFYKR